MKKDWRFLIDFVVFPPLAVIVTALTCDSAQWWAWFAFGVVLFTFIEYWTHRLILHRLMWHSTHERHHTHPEEYSVLPVWLTPAIFGGFFLVFPYAVFAGLVAGYVWFIFWHDALHHSDLSGCPWVSAYARWHELHHSGAPANYGITHPFWDLVFLTYKVPP